MTPDEYEGVMLRIRALETSVSYLLKERTESLAPERSRIDALELITSQLSPVCYRCRLLAPRPARMRRSPMLRDEPICNACDEKLDYADKMSSEHSTADWSE